ncbi:MAG TPA: hypothetical protein VMU89_16595 [Thermomicrobiaceae bacterium]|nr:hypothetical protein [Thermomicrobiaceae bacterium]
MEMIFLGCFVFGALFTAVSAALGFLGAGVHLLHGGAHAPQAPHAGHELPHMHVDHGPHLAHGAHEAPAAEAAHQGPGEAQLHGPASHLPVLNVSSLLAFLTWFGAAGYLGSRFAGWPLLITLPVAIVVGVAGALVIARFLAAVMAGEREMDPADYVLEGTLAQVTVSIPAGGVGEVVFSKAGVRRSEAARSAVGHAIPRHVEVVILDYAHGVAVVQPWNEPLVGVSPASLEDRTPPADVADE